MDESLNQERAGPTDLDFAWRRALDSARCWVVARRAGLLCALLLSLMSANMLAAISRKSITVDEIVMIPAAYYHLAAGNFQLVHDHPPLSKILAALPLLFIQPDELQPREGRAHPLTPEAEWFYTARFWEDNRVRFESISFWARVPMIALTVALGVLVFAFARELFGARAAVIAVALYSLEPTVLAHGRVVQTDVPAAFGYLLLFFALYLYATAPTWRRAAWLGAAGGVAVLAKFSMLIVGPVLAVFFLALLWRAPRAFVGGNRKVVAAHAAVGALSLLLVVNAAYFFRSRPLREADAQWISTSFPSHGAAVETTVRAVSYVLPADMVLGVFWQIWHNREGHPSSLLGRYGSHGWWYYFPVAFALKTTIPFLLLSVASLAWGLTNLIKRREGKFLFTLVPFALYTAFVLLSGINIGVRYYLPAYTFLFILCGAFLDWLCGRRRGARAGALGFVVATVLLGWVGVEAVRAHPDQMTYMNQLASARPHWWYLSDSNVEWGDDVRELAEYLKARGETRVGGAFLGGFLTLGQYGVAYVDLLPPEGVEVARTRYVAVGASYLNGSTVPPRQMGGRWPTEEERVNTFDQYRRREPEAIFGGSIYLFREDGP